MESTRQRILVEHYLNLLNDITECPICAQTLQQPKVLPCGHTFCLKCLQACGKQNVTGNSGTCALCRAQFTIPNTGFGGLPNNYSLNKLIHIHNISDVEKTAEFESCQLCPNENTEEATLYCVECSVYICERCSKIHEKSELLGKNHHTISVNEKMTIDFELRKSKTFCLEHRNKEIEQYCHECSLQLCVLCFAGKHKTHRCTNIDSYVGMSLF